MSSKDKDIAFIRADLDRCGDEGVAYFRLDNNLLKFLNKCREKHDIEGIILTQEDGKIDRNIGFALKKHATKID